MRAGNATGCDAPLKCGTPVSPDCREAPANPFILNRFISWTRIVAAKKAKYKGLVNLWNLARVGVIAMQQ
jgi:hypothetical protein